MDYLKKHYTFIDILMLISVLFIGADIWGFDVAGMNIRYIQIFYLFVLCVLLLKKKLLFVFPKPLVAFVFFFAVSCLFSIDFLNSMEFFAWLLYNVFVIGGIFYSYIRYYGKQAFVDIFRLSLFLITVCEVISAVLGNFFDVFIPFFSYQEYKGIVRTALWFYEPSYLATFLSLYFGFAVYRLFVDGDRNYAWDTALALVCLALTTASTAFVCIAIGFVAVFLIRIVKARYVGRKLALLFTLCAVTAALVLIVRFAMPNVFEVFILRLFRDGLSASSGSRIEGYADAAKLFIKYPFFGVGPNNYGTYFGNADNQPTNVTLELLSTLGIFATVAFYGIIFAPLLRVRRNHALKAVMFAMVLFWAVLQANQNYMRLYLWMWIYVVYAFSHAEQSPVSGNCTGGKPLFVRED